MTEPPFLFRPVSFAAEPTVWPCGQNIFNPGLRVLNKWFEATNQMYFVFFFSHRIRHHQSGLANARVCRGSGRSACEMAGHLFRSLPKTQRFLRNRKRSQVGKIQICADFLILLIDIWFPFPFFEVNGSLSFTSHSSEDSSGKL